MLCSICIDCGYLIESNRKLTIPCTTSSPMDDNRVINLLTTFILLAALKKVNIPSTLEPVALSNANAIRSDGISFIPWTNGLPLAWDYIPVSILPRSSISHFLPSKRPKS
ncbi:unnamed protein product [Gordionus sp. m RMFG-2023]